MFKNKLPWQLVLIHTILVFLTIASTFLPTNNADSSVGFLLMVVTFHIVDMPIGMIFEKFIRPFNFVFLNFLWFIIAGGVYWFLLGILFNLIKEKLKNRKAV